MITLLRQVAITPAQLVVNPPDPAWEDRLAAYWVARDRFVVATTLGFGPRYLHSTGQIHKGGPPSGVFVQFVEEDGGVNHRVTQMLNFSFASVSTPCTVGNRAPSATFVVKNATSIPYIAAVTLGFSIRPISMAAGKVAGK